jgi:hypothetical protein
MAVSEVGEVVGVQEVSSKNLGENPSQRGLTEAGEWLGLSQNIPRREPLERRLLRPSLSGIVGGSSTVNTWEITQVLQYIPRREPLERSLLRPFLRLKRWWEFSSKYLGENPSLTVHT